MPAATTDLATPRARLRAVLTPALLVVAQLALFGPWAVHAANRAEMPLGFAAVAAVWLPAALAAAALLVAIGMVLPLPPARAFVALLFALGVLLWLQGNLLLADYGQLDGTAVDWQRHQVRGRWELALWLAVPLAALAARRRLAAIAPFACGVLLALQTLALAFAAGTGDLEDGPAADAEAHAEAPAEVFQLSRRQNVLVLVLDAFQADVFSELVAAEPARWGRTFDGFVHFREHIGAFPTTKFSIPAMLSGRPYRNRESSWDYIARAFGDGSLFAHLGRHGFEVDLVSISRPFVRGPLSHGWVLPRPYVPAARLRRFAAAQLLDLAAFRQLPHAAKRWLENDQRWRLQGRFDFRDRAYQAVNSLAFLADLGARLTVAREAPVAKVLHVGGAHLPVVLDAACTFIGPQRLTRDSYRAQARCALSSLETLLERLRALDGFDDSLIVVASDHGVFLRPRPFRGSVAFGDLGRIAGTAMALLLVKPPNGRGPLTQSDAPTQITDLPATVFGLLGLPHPFPGRSAFAADAGAPRRRTYGYYRWRQGAWQDGFLDALHLLDLDGSPHDAGAWQLSHSVLSPRLALAPGPIALGTPRARRHLGLGWARNAAAGPGGERGLWSRGRRAALFAALGPAPRQLALRLAAPGAAAVTLTLDGVAAGRLVPAASLAELRLAIAADASRPPISTVVLEAEAPAGGDAGGLKLFVAGLEVRAADGAPLTARQAP